MSGRFRVKDCAGCAYYRRNRGTPDWCWYRTCYCREITFCPWNEKNRMAREKEARPDEVQSA